MFFDLIVTERKFNILNDGVQWSDEVWVRKQKMETGITGDKKFDDEGKV